MRHFSFAVVLCCALLTGCATSASDSPRDDAAREAPSESLVGTYWRLMTLRDEPVTVAENQREAHLVLNPEGRVSGSTGCNRLMGSYQTEGDSLRFSQLASTRMACLGQTQAQEQAWLAVLEQTARYSQSGKYLRLEDAQGRTLAELKVNALY